MASYIMEIMKIGSRWKPLKSVGSNGNQKKTWEIYIYGQPLFRLQVLGIRLLGPPLGLPPFT